MKLLVPAAWFAGVFLLFLTPMELGDIWWHLASGRWMAAHGALLTSDPFSLTSQLNPSHEIVMQGAWLSQVTLFITHRIGGIGGVISLKALAFSLTFILLLLQGRQSKLPLEFTAFLLIPSLVIATYYNESRPQVLTFPLFVALIMVLERTAAYRVNILTRKPFMNAELRYRSPQDQQTESKHTTTLILCLPPLIMLLWANLYPGYVAGATLIIIALIETMLALSLRPSVKAPLRPAVLSSLAALALCAANPTGLLAPGITLSMIRNSLTGNVVIHEHLSVDKYAALSGDTLLLSFIITLIVILGMSFALKALRTGKVALMNFLICAALGYLSIISYRVGIFLALYAPFALYDNLSPMPALNTERVRKTLTAGVLILIISVSTVYAYPRTFMKQALRFDTLFPDNALSFTKEHSLPGNLFHPYEWGGYIMWTMYPDYKSYIDPRALAPLSLHSDVMNARGDWRAILDRYEVNTVLYWPVLPYKDAIPPLILELQRDSGWKAVHWDTTALVFVRSEYIRDDLPALKDRTVWELLTSLISARISLEPDKADLYAALGDLYRYRGFKTDARRAYAQALSLDSKHLGATNALKELTQ